MNELSWPQFRTLNHIKDLPLLEQQRRYYFYLDALSNERYRQNKGQSKELRLESNTFFILQENLDYVLQESGDRLIWKI